MMCYRDRTFCKEKDCNKFNECSRALTDQVQADADKWWEGCKGDAPIATFLGKPDCFEVKNAN